MNNYIQDCISTEDLFTERSYPKDEASWKIALYGSSVDATSDFKYVPDLPFVSLLDQGDAVKLLKFHLRWVPENSISEYQVSRFR
jgi:hypothetical protein